MSSKTYLCIDLKSFYASVECLERNLDPLTTNLVVADLNRTNKTICLAISPSLKKYGLPGRARLFEVEKKIKEINKLRQKNKPLLGKSYDINELNNNQSLAVDYIIAPPRMSYYMKYSTMIYNIYLKYLSSEDIFSYSIDEIFCDVTNYLNYYHCTALELATKMIHDVFDTCGITATAGIGTNLYLCKIAMDIVAKHCEPNEKGVRIAELDEMSYRRLLWDHQPLTDFWRVGKGYAERLKKNNLYTMGDIARCSIQNEDLLYKLFGINAELLIDHAWGYEPCTVASVKKFKPSASSLGTSQVLPYPYDYQKAELVIREMADDLALSLVKKNLKTKQLVLTIGYDIENLINQEQRKRYQGEIVIDRYGRKIPKPSHGTINLKNNTSSSSKIVTSAVELYNRLINHDLLIRRLNLTATHLINKNEIKDNSQYEQISLFSSDNFEENDSVKEREDERLQKIILNIKEKYGKNALLKGINLEDGSTAQERNKLIGGHKG